MLVYAVILKKMENIQFVEDFIYFDLSRNVEIPTKLIIRNLNAKLKK